MKKGGRLVKQSNKPGTTDAWHEAGGASMGQEEGGFMERPRRPKGAMICWKTLGNYCRLNIT